MIFGIACKKFSALALSLIIKSASALKFILRVGYRFKGCK
jgi:hypothetical protein